MTGRVLVVDDIPINQRLLAARLTAEYYEVQCASSGPEALEMIAAKHPDVVLLDVMMPGMTGFEVCEKIKESPEFGHVPVVMVTALDSIEDRIRGLEAGADEFLSKPVNDVALLTRVRSLTRLKRILDELKLREATDDEYGVKEAIGSISGDGGSWLAVDLPGGDIDSLEEAAQICGSQVSVLTDPEAVAEALANGDAELAAINVSGASDGLRLTSQLRARPETRTAPVLLIGDSWETDQLYKGLELGASDYAFRPVDHAELVARIRLQIRRFRFHEQLRDQHRANRALATRDPLTGAFNRRYFNDHFSRLLEHSYETGQPISLIIADIDRFKAINDSHGHPVGDGVLQEFMRRLGLVTRASDMIARLGGEEFAIVTPTAGLPIAARVAERLRKAIASQQFPLENGDKINVTCSFGVAVAEDGEAPDDVIARADAALYEAKRAGRDRVVAASGDEVAADAQSA